MKLELLQVLSCRLEVDPSQGKRRPGGDMTDRRLLCAGVAGTALAALCCFTPALAVLLGALGLSAWLAWADFVLLPALLGCVALIGYALYARRRERPS